MTIAISLGSGHEVGIVPDEAKAPKQFDEYLVHSVVREQVHRHCEQQRQSQQAICVGVAR